MAVRKNPIINTATTLGKLIGFLAVSVLCGVLVAGLVVPVTALGGTTVSNSITAFDSLPDQLKVGAQQGVTNLYASDGTTLLASLYMQNRVEIPLDQMSQNIQNAIIAIEDSRYYEHGGVDTTGILRAIVVTFTKGDRQGASTITQQFVNNTIIQNLVAAGNGDQAKLGDAKTAGDKIREMKLAIAVEKQYSKQDILKGYLNIVNFGNGTYGIQAASQYYFGVNAADLTLAQAALLAGVVNGPSIYDPVKKPDNAKTRRDLVLDRMLQLKKISQADHDTAVATPVAVTPHPKAAGCAVAAAAPFFCDYVSKTILNDPAYGATPEERTRLLYQGGLNIKTTLDINAQNVAQQAQDKTTSPEDNANLNRGSAMISVEPGTGKILTMAQNFKFSAEQAPGQTSINFSVPKVDMKGNPLGGAGTMQVGSTMKPFTFATWLEAGHSMNDVLDGSKRIYSDNKWTNTCQGQTTTGLYTANGGLQNDGPGYYRPMTVLAGLVASVNTITMATAARVDFCKIQQMTEKAGITDSTDRLPLDFQSAANVLGAQSISPLTMANAFATFAGKGVLCDPVAIVSITDQQGKQLPVPNANCKQSIDPQVAAGVMFALKNVISPAGSGGLIRPTVNKNYDIGLKTGTSERNVDTWVVGATSGIATASWFGSYNGQEPPYWNQKVTINGKYYGEEGLDGKDIAGTAWSNFMNVIAPTYKTDAFPAPPAKMTATAAAPPAKSSPPASPPADTPGGGPGVPPVNPPGNGTTNP